MLHFIYLTIIGAWWICVSVSRANERERWRAELERAHRMRLVAESAIDGIAEAWGEQLAINRYRVSEAERVFHKTRTGGEPN